MKIGLLNPTILMRRPIAELASALQARGYDVTIITPTVKHQAPSRGHYEQGDVRYLELPSVEIRRVLWSLPSWTSLRRLWAAVEEFDVLQIWAPYYFVALAPIIFSAIRRGRAKIIITMDTVPGFSFRFGSIIDVLMVWYHRLVASWLFRWSAARTLYSAQLLPFARQAWLGRSFTILPTGINLPASYNQTEIHRPIQLLFIGILNARKGVAVLLTAAKILQDEGLAFHLNIVGDGPQRDELHKQCATLGLSSVVTFVGRTPAVQSYFTQSDVLILPSYGEGLPGVVMEAMAFGVPVVASDIPCLTELIPDQKHGQLVAMGDPLAIAQAIQRYAADASMWRSVRETARRRIELFSWENIVPRYEQLYRQLA